MYQVDLNSDLGESFGRYTIGMDEKIIPLISSANIACGYHASDPVVMLESIARTKEAGIKIGAHPGLPDLMGFGRRNMAISPEEAKAYTLYQISALGGMCKAHNMRLQHVKPHGALYNMAAKDYELSKAICEAIKSYDPEIIVIGGGVSKAGDILTSRITQSFKKYVFNACASTPIVLAKLENDAGMYGRVKSLF